MVESFACLGRAFKAFEKNIVNKILLSPTRENIRCPKALPSVR